MAEGNINHQHPSEIYRQQTPSCQQHPLNMSQSPSDHNLSDHGWSDITRAAPHYPSNWSQQPPAFCNPSNMSQQTPTYHDPYNYHAWYDGSAAFCYPSNMPQPIPVFNAPAFHYPFNMTPVFYDASGYGSSYAPGFHYPFGSFPTVPKPYFPASDHTYREDYESYRRSCADAEYSDEDSGKSCAGEDDSDESNCECESSGWVLEDYPDENSNAQPQIPAVFKSQVDQLTESLGSMKTKLSNPKFDKNQFCYIFVDGYYRKRLSKGGYGVVVTDYPGVPVLALSGQSKFGAVSEYLHTLEGIEASLRLAKKYGIQKFYVSCNSGWVAMDVLNCLLSARDGCFNNLSGADPHQDFDTFCITCCVRKSFTGEERMHVMKVLKEIVMLGGPYYNSIPYFISNNYKTQNRAADFLAKCGEEKEYHPHEIPSQVFQYMVEDLREMGVPENTSFE